MPSTKCFVFENCRIDASAREVWLDGVLCPVAPRIFDLLVYLVGHRNRVVAKDELRDKVWGRTFLSGSVIARAIMKARHAIGDRGDEPRIIRTVHRIGYRFVIPVVAEDTPEDLADASREVLPAPVSAPRVAGGKLRLAVLPFDDRTGDPQFGWMSLGLLSLVNQALETDARLHVSSVATVLRALEVELPGIDGEPEMKARALGRLIGAQCVCGVSVRVAAAGFAFAYWLVGADGARRTGHLSGPEPTALCETLARRIDADLFAGTASAASAAGEVHLESDDPLANQAFARAVQAREMRDSALALKLIRVVLELEPDRLVARLEHFRLLVLCGDPAALPVGEALLQETLDAGDHRLAAELHFWMYNAIFDRSGLTELASHHMDEASRLTGTCRTED